MTYFSEMRRIRRMLRFQRLLDRLRRGVAWIFDPITWRVRYAALCLQLVIRKKENTGGLVYESFES